ncbi:hypothetical protein SAMN05421846_110130 [Chryseobacterium taeanense]|uniref:YD repeat-containing protein n=1 Tax=Chryseobacterium taeanense TaxID=311334 RepID=A0A1G8M0A4_9FLAO|nr:hypothetical protein [Chryseobacterium taeanense]SDI61368.1 hypothetical protein SAMN05421846_110130 [Chryseobacterium taeanense]
MEDENFPVYFKNFSELQNISTLNISNYTGYTPESTLQNNELIQGILDGRIDSKPDIYKYSLADFSGSFILTDNKGIPIPNDRNKIEKLDTQNFLITDEKGMKYYFKNFAGTITNSPNSLPSSGIESYYVVKIVSVNGKEVNFQYNKNYSYTEQNISETDYFKTYIQTSTTGATPQVEVPPYKKEIYNTTHIDKLITKIIFPGGEINFIYNDDAGYMIGNSAYRKDITNGIALREINVKNAAGKNIEKYQFNYSYFISDYASEVPEKYRLKLNSIQNILQTNSYEFEYDESYPFPIRGSSADDHWGYINSLVNDTNIRNLPNSIKSNDLSTGNAMSENILINIDATKTYNYPFGRDKNSNMYAKIGALKSIKYPTGGKKLFNYENNSIQAIKETVLDMGEDLLIYENNPSISPLGYMQTTVNLPPASDPIYDLPDLKFKLTFGNNCLNNIPQDHEVITQTSCTGTATYNSPDSPISSSFNITKTIPKIPAMPITLKLTRIGDCNCAFGLGYTYTEKHTSIEDTNVGGVRIASVEDRDENNNLIKKIDYQYKKKDVLTNTFIGSGVLKSSVQYLKRIVSNLDFLAQNSTIYNPPIVPYFYYQVSNNGNVKNFFGSDNIAGYTHVIETQIGKGRIEYEFSNASENDYSYIQSDLPDIYDNWKNGLLLSKKVFDNNNNLLQKISNKYNFDTRKNNNFGFNTSGLAPEVAFFGANLEIQKNLLINPSNGPQQFVYSISPEIFFGESADIQNYEVEQTDYVGNSTLVSKVTNTFTPDLSFSPAINIIETKRVSTEGTVQNTTYSYAHEKGNQVMIDKNMVGIPLETTTTQTIGGTTKTLSKTETIYPTSLPTSQTGNLVLPTSVLSYDLQNPSSSKTEVTYDKYDSKGNLQQYTTKDGIPTAIIWGYNNTQPIAKVVGATYAQVSNLATAIISASDTDASAVPNNDETAILTALDNFRKDSSMTGYQITTYTYDPLIGVRSITPPSGIREVYLYDTANRLKEIREQNQTGKLLKEFKYNYKN